MVQIMSDSSALYSIAQGKEVGLVVNPLSVSVADKTYREFEEIDSDTFLKLVIEGNTPSSSQPSVGETLSLYEQYGDAPLLNITVADGLSGTYQTASAAAQNMPEEKRKNITVINSGTLCGPHRYLVQKALSLAKEGLSTEEILNALAPSLGNHRSFLIPNDFDFLRRGGRLTPLAAKVGGLLKLVPVMTTTKDGKRLEKFALCRSFASAMETICKNFLDVFQAESVWVPGVSLLDGIAYDFGEKRRFIKSAHNFENDILVASRNIAKRYSSSKDHIQGTTSLALAIFDSMKKVHGMGARERLLLQIAVQLHDCGKYISMADVAECSYRIIMATEIIGLSTEERQVIASAVRYNTTEFVYYENFDDGSGLDRNRYLLVAKLTAILRLANAMDRSHYQKVQGLRAVLKDRELSLIIDSSRDISLELGLLKDKVEFFEEVFGIHLTLRRKRRI